LALATLALIAGVLAAVKVYRDIDDLVRDCYAQWWVAGMVNTFMDFNDGQWPQSWEDLEEPYEIHAARAGRPWTFDDLRSRVEVDFSANPEELAKTALNDGKATFRVVYLRNGKQHHYEGTEANSLIWEHLQKRDDGTAPEASTKRPVPEEKAARRALLDEGGQWKLDDDGHVTELRLVSIPGQPKFSDATLRHVVNLTSLRELDLSHSSFSTWGLVHIKGLTHLRSLNLHGTGVTDSGLANLDNLTELETLSLRDTFVTEGGVQKLLEKLPNCKVYSPSRN
jgi:hypothetical protein